MKNDFTKATDVFLDYIDANEYVQTQRVEKLYDKLKQSVQKPLKMILLYGRPGTGKSMLLSRLHNEMSQKHPIFLYESPITDESEFYLQIFNDLFADTRINPSSVNFSMLHKHLKNSNFSQTPIILLDESQLYPQTIMEKIRLLSDSRYIKFVITLHKTEKEDLIAKEHFQTRIWESVELSNLSKDELKVYIQKKLMQHSLLEIANMFDENSINIIHTYTQGNFRNTNKLLFTLFQIYSFYAQHKEGVYKSKIEEAAIAQELIEMAAIEIGYLHA